MSTQGKSEWLSVPEVAELLDVRLRDVRDLIRRHELLSVRDKHSNTVIIHAGQLMEDGEGWSVLPAVQGTATVLKDEGLSDREVMDWLLQSNEMLGSSPLEALRAGNVHAVRRMAAIGLL